MANLPDGNGRDTNAVNVDQVAYQNVFFDPASTNVHQPISAPHSQNDRSSCVVQETSDAPVGGVQRDQQQQGNGPEAAAAQTQGMAVQQHRQNQKPKTAARANVKIPKPKPDPLAVALDHKNEANRRFVCPLCAKKFFYKHVMTNHVRTHTGEKPYVCMVCQKKFTRAHHLKTHSRLHTGEKPYLCMCCNRVFLQVSNLRRHLKTHIGCTTMNLCVHCGTVFTTVDDLAVHEVQAVNCYRLNRLLRNNAATSTSVATRSGRKNATAITAAAAAAAAAAIAIDSTSVATTSAAAAIVSTSVASTSAATVIDSTFATGFAKPSASAFVGNRPSLPPWRSSTPACLHPTSVHHAPTPWPSTNYGSSSPWVPNAVGYPPPSVRPFSSPLLPPVYSAPTAPAFLYGGSPATLAFLYGLPNQAPSVLHGPQPQLLIIVVPPSPPTAAAYVPPPSLPNGYWTINPHHQYQNMHVVQQTEPEDLSVRKHVPDEFLFDTDDSDGLVDTDDPDKLVIVTDDSGERIVVDV